MKRVSHLLPEAIPQIQKIQSVLGIQFQNPLYIQEAIVHRSFSNEDRTPLDNERLEFLGDSVLGLVCSQFLFQKFPHLSEGELASLKSKMVSARALAELNQSFGFTRFLLLGKGESKTGRANQNIQADLVEAIVGAIYLDQGLSAVESFLHPFFEKMSKTIPQKGKLQDYKTLLQEYCQKKYQALPNYHLVSEEGASHDKIFTIQVSFRNLFQKMGTGKNKKSAETDAARQALETLGQI